MMKVFVISSILFLAITGCVSEEDRQRSMLAEYLEQSFDISIPAEKHYYLLLSESGCRGCRDIAAEIDAEGGYNSNVTVVYFVGKKGSGADSGKNANRHVATIASLHNKGLRYIGTALVETSTGAVQQIHHIDASNLDEILRKLTRKQRET